jgi:hypothetical protein
MGGLRLLDEGRGFELAVPPEVSRLELAWDVLAFLVREHGAAVTASDVRPDGNARFVLSIPARHEAARS